MSDGARPVVTPPHEVRLLVLAPLRIEAAALRHGRRATRVVVTGMGPRAAGRAAREVAGTFGGPIAVAGFCGSLRGDVAPGDVVVADEVRGPAGIIRLPSAPAVSRAVGEVGLRVHMGPILSTDHIVRGAERVRSAVAQSRPSGEDGAEGHDEAGGRAAVLAVDMESFWLVSGLCARQAAAGSARAADTIAVVRVVSDSPASGDGPVAMMRSGAVALRRLGRVGAGLETWAADTGIRAAARSGYHSVVMP